MLGKIACALRSQAWEIERQFEDGGVYHRMRQVKDMGRWDGIDGDYAIYSYYFLFLISLRNISLFNLHFHLDSHFYFKSLLSNSSSVLFGINCGVQGGLFKSGLLSKKPMASSLSIWFPTSSTQPRLLLLKPTHCPLQRFLNVILVQIINAYPYDKEFTNEESVD